MPLLAFNMVASQALRTRYALALGVLPLGLMSASFLPLFAFSDWLERVYGAPIHEPIRDHPNGGAWFLGLMVLMVALMALGYVLGWVLNAVLARLVLRWPAEQVRAVYLRSDLPSHWLRPSADGHRGPNSGPDPLAKWEAQRQVGALRFILKRGVLAWGVPMLLAMCLLPAAFADRPPSARSLVLQMALWTAAGAAFGAIFWHASETNYRKLKNRQAQANRRQP